MRRRTFLSLLGGAAAWQLSAHAQSAIPAIGYLGSDTPSYSPSASPRSARERLANSIIFHEAGNRPPGRDAIHSQGWTGC
jgi:hypothetical protein